MAEGQDTSWLGRYRADRVLGTGGFATVWLATDETLDAQVAIKLLADNWARNADIRRRFTEEARILWRLDNEHVVRVYTVDELEDGRPFFVMEYADAGSLDTRMRQRLSDGEPFSLQESLSLSLAIADGLAAAHARGIVHRDLKPSNVLFKATAGGGERLLLADFGIARSLEAAGASTIAVGTPHYMSPEQSEGRADRGSDVYSAAVILYELLAGTVPFPLPTAGQVLRAQLTEDPPDIRTRRPEVPADLAAVVARGLARDPAQRQASAEAWRADLTAGAVQGGGAPEVPAPPADPHATLGPDDLAAMRAEAAATAAAGAATVASATPAPPPPPVAPTPAAVPPSGDARKRRRRQLLLALVAVLALIGGVVGISLATGGNASADVFLTSAKDPGANGFTPPALPTPPKDFNLLPFLKPFAAAFTKPKSAPASAIPTFTGNTPGLYGGTQQLTVCDAKQLVRFLVANPAKAAAWASTEGITPDQIPAYVGTLTDAILRTDTRVVNHGFLNGKANPIPEVLQAGTAVLVDIFGVPRARCFCGNPLLPPVPLKGTIHFRGAPWPGFDPAKQAVIEAAASAIKTGLVIVDAATGGPFIRVNGSPDTPAPEDVLAGSPFAPVPAGQVAPTTSTTAGPTAGPAPPDAIPGTYTIGSANATGSDCTSTSSPSIVGQQFGVDVSGTTLTLNAGGQSANVPFNPANDTFSLSQADSGSLGFGTSTINGAFTATPSGVALNMQINIFGNCTVAVASTRTGNATQTPATSAPTTAAPTTETPTTAPTSQAPIAITNLGTVSASSTTPGFPASNAVDGDPSTSWFSTGSADGPTSTFTWTLPSDRHITTIAVTGNEQNSNSSFQSGFGYAQTEVQVIDSGGNVTFDQTTNGPSDSTHDFVVNANATGSTVKLILMNRESSACGGFSELVVDAFPS